MTDGPLLVFGPRSTRYDFGPSHPLTPRRFGPGIDLLRAVGAEPGLAPEPASDAELELVHSARYVATVRRFSLDPSSAPAAGIGPGDDPPFAGMHDAAAAVAGGSLRAVEAILREDVQHAFHPGGGLHHAMRDRASGFCVYDDPALAIARARRAGLRVLYVDLDVHHGDGVQAIHADDPGVLTVSFHESGRYLFPGTGSLGEIGQGRAAGTVVNVPFDPLTGDAGWLPAVETLVPLLAAAFGPDLVVSQHGADSHAWDPLAHLRLTTRAMLSAARVVDAVAHREAGGRWLATGGGGYDAYRVVPRAWALTWLAGAHRGVPDETPPAWRTAWSAEAARYGMAPLPATFLDPPGAGIAPDTEGAAADARAAGVVAAVREALVPRLLSVALERGWWSPDRDAESQAGGEAVSRLGGGGAPALVGPLDPDALERLIVAPRTIAPARTAAVHDLLVAAARDGAVVVGAVLADTLVGVGVVDRPAEGRAELLALGVAPAYRRRGLATALLRSVLAALPSDVRPVATVTVAERDPVEPEDLAVRRVVARRLLEGARLRVRSASGSVAAVDPGAVTATR